MDFRFLPRNNRSSRLLVLSTMLLILPMALTWGTLADIFGGRVGCAIGNGRCHL